MSDLEDRIDELDGKLDTLIDRFDNLEADYEQSNYEQDDLHSEFVLFRSKCANEIERVKKILAPATSPDPADLEKFKTLREAFDKYEFTRNLVLGNEEDLGED